MKTMFLVAIAIVAIISNTVKAQASGSISWCEYARLTGRAMAGCNNGQTGNIDPACTSNIVCPATTTCIRGQCVPLVGAPVSEPPVSILPAPTNFCANVFCTANTVCINGKCEPLSSGGGSSSCPANEQYVTCSTCEASCGKPNPVCAMMCGPPKCECVAARGFARDSNGRCVPQSQCPLNNTGKACAATSCPTGQYCVEQQVQCFVPPCNPIPVCVGGLING